LLTENDSASTVYAGGRGALDLSQKATLIHAAASATQPKQEVMDADTLLSTVAHGDLATTLTHGPTTTIILTTAPSPVSSPVFTHSGQAVFPQTSSTATFHIKTEPMEAYDSDSGWNTQQDFLTLTLSLLMSPLSDF
jgi:hypothetical protein